MKGLRVVAMLMVAVAVAGCLTQDLAAESRTLTTTLLITVRPKAPETANAPQTAQEVLGTALSQSMNQRFVKRDNTDIGSQRYTMMEKL